MSSASVQDTPSQATDKAPVNAEGGNNSSSTNNNGEAAKPVDVKSSGGDKVVTDEKGGKAASIADAGSDKGPTPPADWPTDWREKYAGEDKKKLNILSRYSSPKDALDALFNAREKISSGELKAPLAKDATPEQVAQWKAENGLPAKPEEYADINPDGVVYGEADKPILDGFHNLAYKHNLPPDAVKDIKAWWNQEKINAEEQEALLSEQIWEKNRETLKSEWGEDYKRNETIIKNFLNTAPKEVQDILLGAKSSDGGKLLGNALTLKWINSIARQTGMTALTNTSGSVEQQVTSIQSEMKQIEGLMGTKAYTEDHRKRCTELVSTMQDRGQLKAA